MSQVRTLSDYLEEARRSSEEGFFEAAREQLFEALKLPDLSKEEVDQVLADQDILEQQLTHRLQELRGELEEILLLSPEQMTQAVLDAGQSSWARWEDLYAQSPHWSSTDREELRLRWQERRKRVKSLLSLRATRRELDGLWQASPWETEKYDQALHLARQRAQALPDEPAAAEMLAEAQARREKAFESHGILTTAAMAGDFTLLVEEVERFAREGAETLPWYEWGIEREGEQKRSLMASKLVPTADAIRHLLELAEQYQDDKGREYLGRARTMLWESPEGAAKLVQDAQAFEYCSPKMKEELVGFLEDEVQLALDRRERARELVRMTLEADQPVEEKWDLLSDAEKIDPYAPEIRSARKELRDSFKLHLQRELRRATEARGGGDFDSAAEIASRVLEIVERDEAAFKDLPEEARALKRLCAADRDFLVSVEAESERIKRLAGENLSSAFEALTELTESLAGRPERFQRILAAARSAVQARQSVEALLVGWDRRFRALDPGRLDSRARVRDAMDELARLEEEVDAERERRGSLPELLGFVERLESRRHFFEGRSNWETGLYEGAVDAWNWVAGRGQDDAGLADEWLAKARDARAVTDALDQARTEHEEKKYSEALTTLARWRTVASPKKKEAQDLYRTIGQNWATQLDTEILDLVSHLEKRPRYKDLVEKIDQLEPLDPEKARQYRYEHASPIFETWGDRHLDARHYEKAEESYRKAASWATGEDRRRLDAKVLRARRQQIEAQVEDFWSQGKRTEARERLAFSLQGQDPNYVPNHAWLASLFLEEEQAESAVLYLQQMERRLDAADRNRDPGRAGLDTAAEVVEWRLRLTLLREQVRAITDIRESKEQIGQWLRPTSSIREYLRAKRACDQLLKRLEGLVQELAGREVQGEGEGKSLPPEEGLPQDIKERIQRARQEVLRWLREQLRPSAGVRVWYNTSERELLNQIREEWRQSIEPSLETLDFRAVAPIPELLARWSAGFKMRILFRESTEGEKTLLEATESTRRLGRAVKDFSQDPRGPDHSLAQESLEAREALAVQLNWGDHLQSWTGVLADLLGNYSWVSGQVSEGKASDDTYEDIRATRNEIEEFQRALHDLAGAVQEAEVQLDRAVHAGRDGHTRWEHVSWDELVVSLLTSPKVPSPAENGRDLGRSYWSRLDADDPGERWIAWRKAADLVASEALKNASHEINAALQQSGIEEGWEDVEAALKNHLIRFGLHRTVRWILKQRDVARKKRDRLVEARILLAALANAEEFRKALRQMERMERIDPEDLYGFRSGEMVRSSEPLGWSQWKAGLAERGGQCDVFDAWRRTLEQETLLLWQQSMRSELLGLMRQARFEEAERLCRDFLEGDGGGRTRQTGGELALEPLLERWRTPPPDLTPAHSLRLEQDLGEIERQRQGLAQIVLELRFWLAGAGGPGPAELPVSIGTRRDAFQQQDERLRRGLDGLQEPLRRWLSRWWSRPMEAQRRYCLEALEDLRALAPDWPKLDAVRRMIEEA
jgi:hypothetical protein